MFFRSNILRPIQNIIFLKTHKTGSSTVTNILQRYAKAYKLNVALPRCDHRFCYPHKFNKLFLYLHKENETYNILFNHAVFHKENMLNIMTSPNTKIITIIREPYSQFDSTAQYLNFRKFYNLSNEALLLDGFFQKTDNFLTEFLRSADLTDGAGTFSLAKNPNAFDLGFDVWNETSEHIASMIDSLKRDFNLVMIMEHMEESLVLLKNEMRWNLEDVVFYIHNARKVKDKNTNDVKRIKDKILNWNKLDAAIYNYFNKTFWMKIRNAPLGFDADVKKLKEWNQHLVDHCYSFKPSNLSTNLFKKYAAFAQANFCSDFLYEDLNFTNWFKIERKNSNIKKKKILVKYFTIKS